MTDLGSPTLNDELANLQAIANELAAKPSLEHWASSNTDIANHVGAIHKAFSWLPPGVTLALGAARYAPDDPFVKQLAEQSLQMGRKTVIPGLGSRDSINDTTVQTAIDQGFGTNIPGVTPGQHQDFLDRIAGDATGAVGRVVHQGMTDLGSTIPDATRSAIKTGVRDTFAAAQSGLETTEAAARVAFARGNIMSTGTEQQYDNPSILDRLQGKNIRYDLTAPVLPQLTAVQMLNGKSAGQGFFPSGAAAKAAQDAQYRAANIGGHALTIGRGLAGTVLPANSGAYNVVSGLSDAAVSLYGDPAQQVLGQAGELNEARRAVAAPGTDWGRFDQFRQLIGIRTAAEQLNSKVGQGVIQKLADLHDYRSVDHFLGQKVDPMIAAELAATNTPDEVRTVLDRELGTGIEQLPSFHPRVEAHLTTKATDDFGNPIDKGLGSVGYAVDRTTRNWRPLAMLPGGSFPVDLTQSYTRREAVSQMEAFLVNAKVHDAEISPILHSIATSTNKNQLYDAFHEGMDATARTLVREYDIPLADAKKMTRAWTTGGEMKDTTQYFRTSLEDKYVVPGMNIDGDEMYFDGPHLPTEHLQSSIPMPDFREIRRSASDYRKFLRAVPGGKGVLKATDLSTTALDAFMHLWKGAQLVRPALAVRIFGESQLATAAAGDASAFRHPLDWISYVTGHKGAADILGEDFTPADYNKVFKGGAHQTLGFDPDRVWSSQWTHIIRGDPGFTDAWAQEVRHMHIDELGRATAGAMLSDPESSGARNIDELKDAFWSGHLRQTRLDMLEPGGSTWRAQLNQRSVADAYIDMTVTRVRNLTRDDPELLDAIAGGKFRGEDLADMKDGKQLVGRAKYEKAPQALKDRLVQMDVDENQAPSLVKGYLYGHTKIGPGSQIADLRDRATTRAFNMLVGQPVQTLSASPVFKQEYYKEIDKLLPYMDPDEAARAVATAEKSGITGLNASKAAGSLDAKAADTIAKSRSLDTMSHMLHDLGHRGQASDMLRFVAPFGDAWKKVITRWAKLIAENPATVERFRQGITEATRSGFAHTDPQSGKMVFTIPLSTSIDKAITGLPFPQEAPLNGLSIVGSGLPGVGPAVSVPLGLLAPHVPAAKQVLNTLVPFGAPNVRQGVLEAFLPGWANRLRTAGVAGPIGPSPDEQSVFNHSVDEVVRYLVSQGADVSTPEGIAKTVAEARHKATLLYVVRGALQATSPSPPSVQYMVKDKSGRLMATYQLTNELQNLYNGKGVDGKGTNDPSQAAQIFLKLHGQSNYLALQSFSTPRRYGLPTTAGASKWLASHPGFEKSFPNVYGLLTPQKGAFDYSLYLDQLHSGAREDRTSDDFVRLANARIAAMIYDTQRDKLPDDANASDKSQYLGQLRTWLKEKYPGYGAQELNVDKASIPDAIVELQHAADDPLVRKTPAADATRAYLQDRQQVIDFEKQNGSGVTTNALSGSRDFVQQNEWLSQQATKLISQYPTFFPVWDMLLSHEVTLNTPNPAGV